ncbi:MAG TPA: hypothetical protein VFU44_03030 [Candidatus Limnocylindria bacterium]|jgi:hypothetical protein|nr:hypothetical protein [Candidatus Limnocylindria bacterium]
MNTLWTWVKRVAVGAYALVAGLIGGGGRVIVDRRDMYGDDSANDPYSMDFDPNRPRR